MIELPDFRPLQVSQSSRGLSREVCDGLDHVIVVLPPRPDAALLGTVPQGRQIQQLLAQAARRDARVAHTRLQNSRATGVTAALFERKSMFATLTWARKTLAAALREGPRRIGVAVIGLEAAAADEASLALVAAADAAAFKLPSFKTGKPSPAPLAALTLLGRQPRLDVDRTRAAALGTNIARWFTALPPNELTAKSYRRAIDALGKRYGFRTEFLDERKLAERGAGAFLAVSQGNATRDAGIARLRYGSAKPVLALVGKGILFDTGGTNLKPFKSMLDMHTDMQGSAVALGALAALAELGVPYGVEVWLAITENRASATAYKPQDVVRAANGTTIQVIHTDAEGRMALADTLALAAKERPQLIVDYATLTGSCIAALTERYAGVFSNRFAANELARAAGAASGERVWPFPLDSDFDEPLESEIADVKQCAVDSQGDHILAARFLSRFVPGEIPWLHVDLSSSQHKGGLAHVPTEITGFGVRFLLELLHGQSDGPADLVTKLKP